MKIKKVEALVKKEGRIVVSPGAFCQWLQFREAYYPLYGLPLLAKVSFFRMFDISEDKWAKYYFNEVSLPQDICFDDVLRNEQVLDRGTIRLVSGGRTLEPLVTSQGVVFIDTRYLAPFSDDDNYELYERTSASGAVYIAVKRGMELMGVILPHDVVDEEFIARLENLVELSRLTMDNRQSIGDEVAEEQMAMEEADK